MLEKVITQMLMSNFKEPKNRKKQNSVCCVPSFRVVNLPFKFTANIMR